jgi:hypothetical protein
MLKALYADGITCRSFCGANGDEEYYIAKRSENSSLASSGLLFK